MVLKFLCMGCFKKFILFWVIWVGILVDGFECIILVIIKGIFVMKE